MTLPDSSVTDSSVDDSSVDRDGVADPVDDPTVGTVTVELDEAALAVARSAAVAEAGDAGLVGAAVDGYAEDSVAVTARFQALVPGYRGWLWSVTLALLPTDGSEQRDAASAEPSCTVSEVVLLPGPDALLAPAWVPWEQRIRSGDLGVGDLLPPAPDDPRLVPAYLMSDDPAVEEVAQELGIGRVRVLSREGRVDAAERWHDGPFGPDDEMAVHAPGHCATCAFYLPLAGSLGVAFGACGNEFSPADGRVVDAGYGCGAHSEAISRGPARAAVGDTVVDELRLEIHDRSAGETVGQDLEADMTSADDSEPTEDAEKAEDVEPTDAVERTAGTHGPGGGETPEPDPTGLHWPEDEDRPAVVTPPAATLGALAVEDASRGLHQELPADDDTDEGGSSADLARQEE